MTKKELTDSVNKEFGNMKIVIDQIENLFKITTENDPDIIQLTALASFASQFYNGVENILKRICIFNSVTIPRIQDWHIQLYKWFCYPSGNNLPVLFSESDSVKYSSIRKFRHYFFHGYSHTIKWEWLKEGLSDIGNIYTQFKLNIEKYLNDLPDG